MLKVEQLDKWFGRHQVLHKISFEIKPGHILGLMGQMVPVKQRL